MIATLYGLYPGGHHLTNIFLHTANTVLLFRWLSRSTGKLWPSAFVAALFAWHPLHVESVAWICERKDVLSTFFLLLTLGAYTRYVASPTRAKLFLALALFLLGLMAKPMLVTLPCLLLLLDYWPLNRFRTEAGEFKPRKEWTPLFVEKIPFFFLSLCGCLLTMAAQAAGGTVKDTNEIPLVVRVVNAISSYGRYLGKAFWPDRLLIFYPLPVATPWVLFTVSLVVLVVLTALAVRWHARFPWFIVGWFWFLGTLVPVIGLVQVGDQAMADRYTYIPYIGLSIVVVWAFDALCRKHFPLTMNPGTSNAERRTPNIERRTDFPLSPENHPSPTLPPTTWRGGRQQGWLRCTIVLLGSAALVACAVRTHAQLGYWKDSITVFGHAAQFTAFNKFSHANLNYALSQKKHADPVPRYRAVMHPEAHDPKPGKGGIVFDTDSIIRVDDGVIELLETVNYDPNSAALRNNLGILLREQDRPDEAIEQFEKAIALDPKYAWAYFNDAIVLRERGRVKEAGERRAKAIELRPGLARDGGREP